jgi:hypothetical protein
VKSKVCKEIKFYQTSQKEFKRLWRKKWQSNVWNAAKK